MNRNILVFQNSLHVFKLFVVPSCVYRYLFICYAYSGHQFIDMFDHVIISQVM